MVQIQNLSLRKQNCHQIFPSAVFLNIDEAILPYWQRNSKEVETDNTSQPALGKKHQSIWFHNTAYADREEEEKKTWEKTSQQ